MLKKNLEDRYSYTVKAKNVFKLHVRNKILILTKMNENELFTSLIYNKTHSYLNEKILFKVKELFALRLR